MSEIQDREMTDNEFYQTIREKNRKKMRFATGLCDRINYQRRTGSPESVARVDAFLETLASDISE